MCILLVAHDTHPDYSLVLAANRDEAYDRPAAPAAFWDDAPDVLAGRDLQEGGTWLGVTLTGRWAALTNFREPAARRENAPSRGGLVARFLRGSETAGGFVRDLACGAAAYNGFSLFCGVGGEMAFFSNRGASPRLLPPGLYGLSNGPIETPWPKVELGRAGLGRLLRNAPPLDEEAVFALLGDTSRPGDSELPDTGVGLAIERALSPVFVATERYGTRCSTLLVVERTGGVLLRERTHGPGEGGESVHRFRLMGGGRRGQARY